MNSSLCVLLSGILAPWFFLSAKAGPVPPAERDRLGLDSRYQQYASAGGFPVVASERVVPFALAEAAYVIDTMLEGREDVRLALIGGKVRFTVMAVDEFTTDVPEHHHLRPAAYWDRRARGLGSSFEHPAVSCGEENLLDLEGDPYAVESICVHEFAHAIHQQGLNVVDPTFQGRLEEAFAKAKARGLWKPPSYAGTNPSEYWAEGVQSWFDTNRENDNQHNEVNTRAELKDYDPGLAALITEVFGDHPWRYVKPRLRTGDGTAHLAGFGRAMAPVFRWPETVVAAFQAYERGDGLTPIASLPLASLESRVSPAGGPPAFVEVRNRTGAELSVQWIDFKGAKRAYGSVAPGGRWTQQTFAGHLWLLADPAGKPRFAFAVPEAEGTFTATE